MITVHRVHIWSCLICLTFPELNLASGLWECLSGLTDPAVRKKKVIVCHFCKYTVLLANSWMGRSVPINTDG